MPSLQANFVKLILKMKPYRWAKGSLEEQRSRTDKTANRFRVLKNIEFNPIELNGVTAEWIISPDSLACAVLYLHGGAFVLGSIKAHREILSRLASATRAKVLAIDYRLAPEHSFPAALKDALFAYHWLLHEGWDSSRIVIAGDSAGGGLTLSTIAALSAAGDPLPACAVCLSPWVDLTLSSKSILGKAKADPLLSEDILLPYANDYAGDYEKDYPLISPLFAGLKDFCPVLIHVGTDEIFLDEAIQFTKKAQAAGVDAKIRTWEGLFHVFQMVPFLPETKESLEDIAGFIAKYVA